MLADFFAFLISLFPALGGLAPEGKQVIPVKTKAPLVLRKKDFYHTFSYQVVHGRKGMTCQATRINSRWFVTAAHCVKDICRHSCTIEMDLMDADLSVKVGGWHDASYNYSVFVHPGYNKTKTGKDDFALIRLDVKKAGKTYYQRSTGQRSKPMLLSKRQFLARLQNNSALQDRYTAIFNFTPPEIVEFEGGNYEILRTLSVVDILNGKRVVKQNSTPVYYVKKLGYAYTYDFGIHKGMSGSGVISDKRELVGIISSNVKEDYYNSRQRVGGQNWFVFPVFNEEVIAFMQAVMGDEFNTLKIKKAYPSVVKKTDKDFSSITSLVRRAEKG